MSRLFITPREISFFADITKQLIKDIVSQNIYYYAINEETTKRNDLYNESSQKVFDPPVEIEVLVEWNGESEVTSGKFGIDHIFDLKVFFHKRDLDHKNIVLREGDFLQYNERFFEVQKLTIPKDIAGQNEHIIGIHADCRIAREGQFRTATIKAPTTFTQPRGRAGNAGAHDIRELQIGNDPVITPLTGTNTTPFTTNS